MSAIVDWWRRSDWGLHIAVAAISLGLALLALEIWRADLLIPFTYSGDAIPVAAHFKTTFETGWYEFQPLLGAPHGQSYHDFPTSDELNFLMASILGHLFGNWTLALNMYFLIGFPLAGAAASWFLRIAGASRAMTLAVAPLFAILSYHFLRGEPHLFLSSYFVVPLSLVIVLRAARGERLWGWREGSDHPIGRWFGRGTQTVVIAFLTGFTQAYYAVFALILLAFAGIFAVIRDRNARRFWGAVLAGGIVAVVMIGCMVPDLLFALQNGPNPVGFQRGHADAEIYALKLAQLVLPWDGHRIEALRDIRGQYDSSYPLLSEQPSLGIVAAIGFLMLLGIVVFRAVAGFRGVRPSARTRTISILGALVLIAFLFATVGGFSSVISFFTASIRGWNRMSVFIALISLAAVALLLDAWLGRIAKRSRMPGRARAIWAAVFAVVVLVVGYIDQTPGNIGDGYAPTIARWQADATYFQGVQAQLQPGDWVVQLPYNAFPESVGPTGVLGSEVLIPYLHTTQIGWTGGGIKGRPSADWTNVLEDYPPQEIPVIAATAGASGILLDRHALPASQNDIAEGLETVLGTPDTSADGRYSFWTLHDVAAEVAASLSAERIAELAAAITEPVTLDASASMIVGWDPSGAAVATLRSGEAPRFVLINARDTPMEVELTLDFSGDAATAGGIVVTLDDGTALAPAAHGGTASGTWTVVVPPGVHRASITAASTSGLAMHWRTLDPMIQGALAGLD